jgi:hypothetical protein
MVATSVQKKYTYSSTFCTEEMHLYQHLLYSRSAIIAAHSVQQNCSYISTFCTEEMHL